VLWTAILLSALVRCESPYPLLPELVAETGWQWLSASCSDGRCPTCRVPLSLETDTISLHPPVKRRPSAVSFMPEPLPPRRGSPSDLPRRRFILSPRDSSSSSSSSSSQELESDAGSSSTSDGEDGAVPKRSWSISVQPKYESMSDMVSDLVPLREFGSLLSFVGCSSCHWHAPLLKKGNLSPGIPVAVAFHPRTLLSYSPRMLSQYLFPEGPAIAGTRAGVSFFHCIGIDIWSLSSFHTSHHKCSIRL
jgi:hypothetical protein